MKKFKWRRLYGSPHLIRTKRSSVEAWDVGWILISGVYHAVVFTAVTAEEMRDFSKYAESSASLSMKILM